MLIRTSAVIPWKVLMLITATAVTDTLEGTDVDQNISSHTLEGTDQSISNHTALEGTELNNNDNNRGYISIWDELNAGYKKH